MTRLATTALGGLAALAALLLLRGTRSSSPARRETTDAPLLLIYTEPRYDTPPAEKPAAGRDRLVVLPVHPSDLGAG